MRILGLDVGERTIGVAVSDGLGLTAQGVTTLYRKSLEHDLKALQKIMEEYEVQRIVVGLPISLDGTLKVQAEKVAVFMEALKGRFSQEVVAWDERLSTAGVERSLRETGASRKSRKRLVNELAAQWILQGYMDKERS